MSRAGTVRLVLFAVLGLIVVCKSCIAASRPESGTAAGSVDGYMHSRGNTGRASEVRSGLRRQWDQCGCAALEMACETIDAGEFAEAVAACVAAAAPTCVERGRGGGDGEDSEGSVSASKGSVSASKGPVSASKGSSVSAVMFAGSDSKPREECARLLRRQVRVDEPPRVTAMGQRNGVYPAGKAARNFGWRVFGAPWCCGECCYSQACFPCYTLLYDYVDRRVQYLALVAGVAPPAPPPFVVIPGGFVPIVRPGFGPGLGVGVSAGVGQVGLMGGEQMRVQHQAIHGESDGVIGRVDMYSGRTRETDLDSGGSSAATSGNSRAGEENTVQLGELIWSDDWTPSLLAVSDSATMA